MKKLHEYSSILTNIMLAFFILSWNSCAKDIPELALAVDYSKITSVGGLVKTKEGIPLQGVLVTTNGKSTVTDAKGAFLISEVNSSERLYVTGSKSGYFNGSVGISPKIGEATLIEMRMIENVPNFSISPTTTQDLTLQNGAGIRLNANSVADLQGNIYTGNLNVAVMHLDPADPDFAFITPGGDLLGTNASGVTRQLLSYGMLMVELTDENGNELQLANGNTSTLTMPVPNDMIGNAPPVIPLWHFDEPSGIWKEEGQATLQDGKYVGTVSHFSSWNCDQPSDRGTIRGRIIDCNNQPVQGISVKIGQVSAITDSDGIYERFVPSNTNITVQVDNPELGVLSNPINVENIAGGQTQTVNDIAINCLSYISGTTLCSTNLPVLGYAAVNVNGSSFMTYIQGNGEFKIAVPNNGQSASITVVNSLLNYSETRTVTLPSLPNTTVNVGTFDVCQQTNPTDPSVGSLQQSFTLNGDGFNNQNIVLNAFLSTGFAVYSQSNDATFGIASADNSALTVTFPGNSTGSFNLPNDDVSLSMSINDNQYVTDENLQLVVTEFGGVGQKIKGTFSGTGKRFVFNEATQTLDEFTVEITNGNFEFQRNPDDN